jgi:hypothetical protein
MATRQARALLMILFLTGSSRRRNENAATVEKI